jgi:transposase-like protein
LTSSAPTSALLHCVCTSNSIDEMYTLATLGNLRRDIERSVRLRGLLWRPCSVSDRRAVKARGHFPTEQAALKCLYLVTRSLDPKGTGQTRWAVRWKPALNAFAITFADRMAAAEDR